MNLTARQRAALQWLHTLNLQYPWTASSGLNGRDLGRSSAAVLRKLEPKGLVIIRRPASNFYRYILTDAGRKVLGIVTPIGGAA